MLVAPIQRHVIRVGVVIAVFEAAVRDQVGVGWQGRSNQNTTMQV
jgi:hypothetical protein